MPFIFPMGLTYRCSTNRSTIFMASNSSFGFSRSLLGRMVGVHTLGMPGTGAELTGASLRPRCGVLSGDPFPLHLSASLGHGGLCGLVTQLGTDGSGSPRVQTPHGVPSAVSGRSDLVTHPEQVQGGETDLPLKDRSLSVCGWTLGWDSSVNPDASGSPKPCNTAPRSSQQ